MALTIEDLKKNLGPGLGLRKSKYLLEVPVPGSNGKKLNILCRATSLPERNITTTSVYHLGRKYNMRAETIFAGVYNISVVDDSKMTLRELFDNWLSLVDQTKPKDSNLIGKLGSDVGKLTETVDGLVKAANTLKTSFETDGGMSFLLNAFDGSSGHPIYQTDINIWQLGNGGEKVYGYKLQNAYPTTLGTVELDDGDTGTLSEFSIDFTYSEFIPIKNDNSGLIGSILGTTGTDIVSGVTNLF
jgi:hypothetical protein